MKAIILVDSNTNSFNTMVNLVNDKNIVIVDTEQCDEPHEYTHLMNAINEFSKSSNEIMLGRFSGKESVIRELGDECSDMIITLSSNSDSQYYTEHPVAIFSNIIQALEKETRQTKILTI